MKDSITISAVSQDGKRVYLTPGGDTTRGVWVDVGAPIESVSFPKTPFIPRLQLAPWGAGKGIKGGFSGLRGRT